MAEQNLEITYIPYGLDEISQLDLMTNLANGVEGYLGSKRWARKDKYRNAWLAAYLDIIGRGLVGASNDNGIWTVNHNGEAIPLDSKSNIEREMYQDAAYYIQLQMAKMTPRKKEEEKKKEDLTPFKFKESFGQLLLNNRFGGDSSLFGDSEQGWNALDARDEKTGLRGTAKRREAMASELEAYLKTIEDGKFNFEGTSFKDENDARTKIQTAINALRNTPEDESDDIPAFNALGLNYRSFFSNGGNEASTHLDSNGTPYTYNLWNQLQLQLAETKAKQEAEKLKAIRANLWDGYKYYNYLNGTPSNALDFLNIQLKLTTGQDLDGNDISRLSWAFKLALKSNGLINLSKEELSRMPRYANNPSRLKKLNGIDGIYFDTYGNKFVKPYKNNLQQGITLLNILDLNNPELLELKRLELQNSKKLKDEDWDIITADTVSMLGDLVSLGGGYAGAAGGATTILSDLYADLRRGKDFWDVTKNLAKNAAWGFAGLIPGVKLAKLGKRAALLYALYNSWGIITDPDVHKSWKKLINGEDFTSHDFENLKWTLHAVTGVHNTARSHFSDKALNNKLNNNKVVVETKNGKRTITTELQKEINKAGGRGGQEAANKKFLEYAKAEAKEGSFEFNSEGRKWYNPTRYSQKLRNAVSNETKLNGTPTEASKMTIGRMLVLDRNKPIIANPFSSSTYKNWWTSGGPNRGYTTMALGKTYLNIKQNNNVSESSNKTTEESNTSEQKISKEPISIERILKIRNSYKEYLNINSSKGRRYSPSKNDIGINPDKLKLSIEINGEKLNIDLNSGKLIINGKDTGISISGKSGMRDVRKEIAKEVKQRMKVSSGKTHPLEFRKMVLEILKLKRSGFLKQGGTLNSPYIDTVIEDFFKNNNI